MGKHITFLSRGNGYSHAAKDFSIINEIYTKRTDIEVSVASSGKGLEYYKQRSMPCLDLGIPDEDDHSREAEHRILRYLAGIKKPDLIVANEVFFAPNLCTLLGYPNLFLTHWFDSELGMSHYDKLLYGANAVILLDFAEAHHIPEDFKVPVHFTGALAKEFSLTREQARTQLNLSPDAFIITATFGSYIPPELAPDIWLMLYKIYCMWQQHDSCLNDRLFILSNLNHLTRRNIPQDSTIDWVGICKTPEIYYRASDVVFASATFTALSDLSRNKIPTVAIVAPSDLVAPIHTAYYESLGLVKSVNLDIQPDQLWLTGQSAIQKCNQAYTKNIDIAWGNSADIATLILSYLS